MLADTKLRSQVDSLWDKLWSGGLSNPLDAVEQLSYLIFLKQLTSASRTPSVLQKSEARSMSRSLVMKNCVGHTGANCPAIRLSKS